LTGGCARISKRRSRSVGKAGLPLGELPQISVEDLSQRLQSGRMRVLDVRREREWEDGHIEAASWWPLDNFKVAPPEIDRNVAIAVHCKGGYRSMIACSLLQRAGFGECGERGGWLRRMAGGKTSCRCGEAGWGLAR